MFVIKDGVAHMNDVELRGLISDGYLSVQKHPTEELYLYNYTDKTQWNWKWNPITLNCRGLILDKDNRVISRPFPKFFNLDEVSQEQIPRLPFTFYEKYDGALGILYWVGDVPYIATRGSFESDHAKVATHMLHTKYSHILPKLNKNLTYLFEIISPVSKVVVEYDEEKLVLIAQISNRTGREANLDNTLGFEVAKTYPIRTLQDLERFYEPNKEGFVIRFSNGFRLKYKFSKYKKLHRIVVGMNTKKIWKALMDNDIELIRNIPDEFMESVSAIELDFLNKFSDVEREAKEFLGALDKNKSRRELASEILNFKYSHVVFSMLDDKDYSKLIWKIIEPKEVEKI